MKTGSCAAADSGADSLRAEVEAVGEPDGQQGDGEAGRAGTHGALAKAEDQENRNGERAAGEQYLHDGRL